MDAGALHPRLRSFVEGNYYKECKSVREELKDVMRPHIGDNHTIYIVSNTTHGLLAILSYLATSRNLIDTSDYLYPGFEFLQRDTASEGQWSVKTHICPVTGNALSKNELLGDRVVVDGAQSFFTASHHPALLHAKVFIAPFHKNLGIQVGMGMLAISDDVDSRQIHDVAKAAESGAGNINLMLTALNNLKAEGGSLYNCTVINNDKEILDFAKRYQIEIVTPPGLYGPFVCLKTDAGSPLPEIFHKFGFETKYFPSHGVLRVSKLSPGPLESKIDFSKVFFEALQYTVGHNG
ncbi:DUF6024 family protein [Halomonas koreensis]|uniref:DUF6024 family protein n=1 Tax=Halomonas koreensis TaxID=245385 RepID=A0ABU1FZS1_9GAMM|nr:DUF6024 family protein [Halomonas koreensis]MDR5866189.1 DUF6024 family protein [Halomonas koreensis]